MLLFEGNVYYFNDNGNDILGVFLCRSIKKLNYYLIPLQNDPVNTAYKLVTLNKYAIISNLKEVHLDDIKRVLYIKKKPIQLTNSEYIDCYIELIKIKIDIELRAILSTIPYGSTKDEICNYFEESIKFVNWQHDKFNLTFNSFNNMSIFENGVYWIDFGYNIGTEINKQRPAIVWKKILNNNSNPNQNSYICIPLTSQSSGKAYYYYVPILIDGKTFYARVNDMRRVNQSRIKRPQSDQINSIHYISKSDRDSIKDAIRKYFVF